MTDDPYLRPAPPWLEDEVIMLENSGEMPEVVLAESLHHLGSLPLEDLDILRAATVRGYLKIIERDLDPAKVGLPPFRGLGRAGENLARLASFLERLGWPPPLGTMAELARHLADYLSAENLALAQGRPYASATRGQAEAAARLVGLDLSSFQDVLAHMDALPAPDFWGLRTLRRLGTAQGQAKRRHEAQGKARLEVLDRQGNPLEAMELPLTTATDNEDPECRARVELVWSLIPLPEA
ncbi:MAG: hypothetical protein KMY53_18980 [Desulfarculus sp.]|nr:hypothetical protein [Pseudomonadota bacterium]MBV1714767.1 hypothetical protein [Desulfarculus sp.]MBU4573370.1 hypothetical protein [Pseudomonadota bacterium]MBU4600308.1 hypothetical protein [Pseudomonadota bacterium]MBV1740255.1 hypothetical protein [Desulfarculus sp.]